LLLLEIPMRALSNKVLVPFLMLMSMAVQAADPTPSVGANDKLRTAREYIAQKNWTSAIEELKQVNSVDSADWNNLMGYSLRKAKTPVVPASERFYDAALKIDPQHRGALEYSGELYLMKGDLAKAEQRLATLDRACLLPCEEYTQLKKAVQRFKANDNRHVAAP
jgi:Flp pilus assembly protein TadD